MDRKLLMKYRGFCKNVVRSNGAAECEIGTETR